ncbi:MAG: hypothetical protein PSV46_17995 [Reyranella sp.]|nr:hypothetical protein [Reyranella sp.]
MIRVMIGTVAVLAGFAVVECSPDAGTGLTGARAHDEQGRRDQETAPTGPRTALPRTAVAQYIFGDF